MTFAVATVPPQPIAPPARTTDAPNVAFVFALGVLAGLIVGAIAALLVARRRVAPKPGNQSAIEPQESPPANATPVRPLAPTALAENPVETDGTGGKTPPQVAMRLIELRDQVLASHDGSQAPNDWLYDRLGSVLASIGITPIETNGAIDYESAEAVGTKTTDDPALDQTIASTVRPGYAFAGTTVRPQQVIVYVKRP